MTTLSRMGESAILKLIAQRLGQWPAAALGLPGTVGPGDDASVTWPSGALAATTDMIVQGQDFLDSWLDFPACGRQSGSGCFNLGVKAAAQNLADVYAMGATPHGLLVSLGLPGSLTDAQLMDFYDGLLDECARAGTGILGGDVGEADRLIVSITALGELLDREPLRRGGARPGDAVFLAGTVGHAAAGLDLLLAGVRPGDEPALDPVLGVQLAPRPDYATAALLPGWAHACIDASDGLAGDLGRVATASGVSIDLDPDVIADLAAELLPAAEFLAARGAQPAAGRDPADMARHWVLTGGEDHGFLCTGPVSGATGMADRSRQWPPVGLRRIGECVPAPAAGGGLRLDGETVGGGFRHFGR